MKMNAILKPTLACDARLAISACHIIILGFMAAPPSARAAQEPLLRPSHLLVCRPPGEPNSFVHVSVLHRGFEMSGRAVDGYVNGAMVCHSAGGYSEPVRIDCAGLWFLHEERANRIDLVIRRDASGKIVTQLTRPFVEAGTTIQLECEVKRSNSA